MQRSGSVTDMLGIYRHCDRALINPWGILALPEGGPLIVANNGSSHLTAYSDDGRKVGGSVAIPFHSGGARPTGLTLGKHGAFHIRGVGGHAPSTVLVCGEEGGIYGWNVDVDPAHAIQVVCKECARYTGLCTAVVPAGQTHLFACDFAARCVDVFDECFVHVCSFTDPLSLEEGFSPFNVFCIGCTLYVAMAKVGGCPNTGAPLVGEGCGRIVMFSTVGEVVGRLHCGGVLNCPWGMACKTMGDENGCPERILFVSNFGDGRINAFRLGEKGRWLGCLEEERVCDKPFAVEGLRGICFGNGGLAGCRDVLVAVAGVGCGRHGAMLRLRGVGQDSVL